LNRDLKIEMRLAAMRLKAYDRHKAQMKAIVEKLIALHVQRYETRNGKRVKLTRARKLAKAREIIDTLEPFDVRDDLKAQMEIMDAG